MQPNSARTGKLVFGKASALLALGLVVVTLLVYVLTNRRSAPIRSAPLAETARSELHLENGRLHWRGDASLFTGCLVERYADGSLQSRSAVVDGQLHGLSQGWFTNGQLQVSEWFKHGLADGPRLKYYANGHKLSEGNLVAGQFDGVYRKWHENGVLAEQAQFKLGQPIGVSTAYFPSGNLKARVSLADGKPVEQHFWKDGESREPLLASDNSRAP